MRSAILLATLLLPTLAAAQTQPPGTTAPGPARSTAPNTTPAPVPSVAPGVPATGSASVVPEVVAPTGLSAGPANATPFSAGPSSNLPSDQSLPTNRDQTGGATGAPPNLSR